jgi:Ni/Co efflux regulator RcnB
MKKLMSVAAAAVAAIGMTSSQATETAKTAKPANKRAKSHPEPKAPDSRQVRRQKERLASKPSLVNPKVLGRER